MIWQMSHWNRSSPLNLPENYIHCLLNSFSPCKPKHHPLCPYSTMLRTAGGWMGGWPQHNLWIWQLTKRPVKLQKGSWTKTTTKLSDEQGESGMNITLCRSRHVGDSACWQWHNDGMQTSNQLLMNASRSGIMSLREGPTSEQRRWQGRKASRQSCKHDHVTATSLTSRSLHNTINLQLAHYQEDSVASRRTKVAVGQPWSHSQNVHTYGCPQELFA